MNKGVANGNIIVISATFDVDYGPTYLQRHWQCQASARFTLHFKDFLAYLKNGLPVQPVNLYQLVVVHEIQIIGSFMKNTWNSMPPSRQVKHRCHFCVDVGCCYTYDIVNELKAPERETSRP